MARANDKQIGGHHYKGRKIEPWDYCLANNLGYLESSGIKYITRWKDKGGIADIEKAIHYLEKLVEWTKDQEKSTRTFPRGKQKAKTKKRKTSK